MKTKMIYFIVNEETDIIEKVFRQKKRAHDFLNMDETGKYCYRGFSIDTYKQTLLLRPGDNMREFCTKTLNQFYYHY